MRKGIVKLAAAMCAGALLRCCYLDVGSFPAHPMTRWKRYV